MDFEGKVVLVTGASSGIGATTAETFARRGAKVVLVGRKVDKLQETQQLCVAANAQADTLVIPSDVTEDAEKIINETIEKYGQLDVLVNNAGILERGNIQEIDIDQFDRVLNTNLRAVFMLTKLAVPHLIETIGNIVNVSSIAGLRSSEGFVSYCVSKSALDQFTRCIALDLAAQQVRVNSVNPGVIVTDIHIRSGMSKEVYAQHLEHSKSTHAMGRVGHTQEVADTIAFLASKGASFITGACIPIDGGRSLMCPR